VIAGALTALLVALIAGRLTGHLLAGRGGGRSRRRAGAVDVDIRQWRRARLRLSPPGEADVARWCEQVASALRGGDSLTHAVVTTDAAWVGEPVVPTVAHAVRHGRGLAEALDGEPGDPATASGLAVAVLRSCARMGGPAAAPVERVADTLAARAAERAERHAASAQARLSARVLTFVPFAVLALLAVGDRSVRAALTSPGGVVCVAIGGGLNLLGWWWMRRLIGRAE